MDYDVQKSQRHGRVMFLPVASALLGIFAFLPMNMYAAGLFFLVPLFVFFLKQKKIAYLLVGTFMFRLLLLAGSDYFAFDPLIFLISSLTFLGLPISFFLIRKYSTETVALLLLPFLWTFWDHGAARYSFLPFFTIMTGNIFGSSPFLGVAGIGGLAALTFFAAATNTLAAYAIADIKKDNAKKLFFSVLIILALVGAGWGISILQLRKNSEAYHSQQQHLVVAAISSNKKFDEEYSMFSRDTFSDQEKNLAAEMVAQTLEPIRSDLRGKKLDLIVFPEDMIDIEIWNDADKEAQKKFGISNAGILIRAYRDFAKELRANVLATFTTIQNGKRYNTTLLFNRNGELIDLSNKSHLVIAGEYWPFGSWRPFYYNWLKKISPDIGEDSALFNEEYRYHAGERKVIKSDEFVGASSICVEIHYPQEMKTFKKMGAQFISHTSTNRWITIGLKQYLNLLNNLRKIEAVWLQLPIVINGRQEMAGVITPDGKSISINFESEEKNYGVFIGKLNLLRNNFGGETLK